MPIEFPGLTMKRRGAHVSFHIDGVKLLSISAVKSVIEKNLMNWAAREERKLCGLESGFMFREHLDDVARRIALGAFNPADLACEPAEWLARLEGRLGRKLASELIRDEATETGKEVHAAMEWWFADKLHAAGEGPRVSMPLLRPAAQRSFDRLMAWVGRHDVQVIASEVSACSPTHRFTCRADHVVMIDGVVGAFELKTGSHIYHEDRLQVVASRRAVDEYAPLTGVDRVSTAWLVRAPKNEEDAQVEVEVYEHGTPFEEQVFGTFLAALRFAEAWEAMKAAGNALGEVAA